MAIFPSITTGFGLPLADAQDRHLGRVDDRREMAAADAALVGNRKRAALQLFEGNLALAGLLRERVQLLRKLKKIFLVDVAQHRHDQPAFGVHGDADVAVVFVNDLVGCFVHAGVGARMLFQSAAKHQQQKRREREMGALFLIGGGVLFAQRQQMR